jgi:hypothetical protein
VLHYYWSSTENNNNNAWKQNFNNGNQNNNNKNNTNNVRAVRAFQTFLKKDGILAVFFMQYIYGKKAHYSFSRFV